MKKDMSYIRPIVDKYKYALMVLALGLFIVLLPSCEKEETVAEEEPAAETAAESLAEELCAVFSEMEGVGRVKVVLTLKSGYSNVFAYDEKTSSQSGSGGDRTERSTELVVIGSSAQQGPVVRRVDYPQFQGALVVCDGGSDPGVQYRLTQAVMSLTGLSADRIVVAKMEK